MGIFNYFKRKEQTSAKVAKERLQILIAHERVNRDGPDYIPELRQEILDVIRKYVNISDDDVNVNLEKKDRCDVLELNIALPEKQ